MFSHILRDSSTDQGTTRAFIKEEQSGKSRACDPQRYRHPSDAHSGGPHDDQFVVPVEVSQAEEQRQQESDREDHRHEARDQDRVEEQHPPGPNPEVHQIAEVTVHVVQHQQSQRDGDGEHKDLQPLPKDVTVNDFHPGSRERERRAPASENRAEIRAVKWPMREKKRRVAYP